MKKINLTFIIYGVIFVAGLIIIMNSINMGNYEVSNIMNTNGGHMDTGTYLIYLEQSITKYRVIGSVLSIFGGLGVLKSTKY